MSDIKLSTAIREGAQLRPQSIGAFFRKLSNEDNNIGSCVLGACAEGSGLTFDTQWVNGSNRPVIDYLEQRFPTLDNIYAFCPHDECKRSVLYDCLLVLNDTHKWTREAIADWLASIGY